MTKKLIEEFNRSASWLKEGMVYHRGKHNGIIKENTIKAFEEAIKDDLAIEYDVRLTKDNKVVVCHDDSLKRVFGVDKNISECTYEEVKEYSNNEVPLFEDVLKLVDNNIGMVIEVKSTRVGKLEETVYNILKKYNGRYVIESFNPFSLRYFKKKDSSIIRGQLSYNYKNSKYNFIFKAFLRKMWFNIFSKPHFISYGINGYDVKVLAKYRKKGYFIIGWTYKDEVNKEELSKLFDNMIMEGLSTKEF